MLRTHPYTIACFKLAPKQTILNRNSQLYIQLLIIDIYLNLYFIVYLLSINYYCIYFHQWIVIKIKYSTIFEYLFLRMYRYIRPYTNIVNWILIYVQACKVLIIILHFNIFMNSSQTFLEFPLAFSIHYYFPPSITVYHNLL